LEEKVACYREIKDDFVRSKPEIVARFKSLPVDDKLFSEISILQRQIAALLGCTVRERDNINFFLKRKRQIELNMSNIILSVLH